jgi:uncharacterized protein (DUF58 family)
VSRDEMISPRVLARIRDLRLLARRVVEGMHTGIHESRQRGAGMEFNQYRTYEPGDDPSLIDWKLYARSDRYFVRESQRESQLSIWFLLDLTASMAQPSEQVADWTKLRYAQAVIASLGWLALRQGDAFGLLGFARERLAYVPCRRGRRHFDEFTVSLARLEPGGRWPLQRELDALWEQMRSPGLALLITDLFEHEDEITTLAGKLAAAGKDVLVMQLLTQAEREFPWRGEVVFRDRETGREVELDASRYAPRYLERFTRDGERLARDLRRQNIEYREVLIESPLDEVLARYLETRAGHSA